MASVDARPTMENKEPPVPHDLKHVSIASDLDVQYWSKRFQTSRHQLEQAVEQVGHSVNAVADYLERNRHLS